MTRSLRRTVVGLAFAVATVLLLLWLSGVFAPKIDDAPRAAAPPPTARTLGDRTVVPVRTIRVPDVETAAGTVEATHRTSLASRLLSTVTVMNATAGRAFREGDVLAELDRTDLEARLQQARAALAAAAAERDQASIDLARARELKREEVISQSELDRAVTRSTTAEAEVERAGRLRDEAETTLGFATIRAPFDGVVVDKRVEVGDTVTPGQVLLDLYDPTRMQLVAPVRESLARRLTVGDAIDVRIDALDKTCEGTIREIVPSADAASRTFEVKVTGPCPPDVYSGMFGRLSIPLDVRTPTVVPRAAIRHVGQLDLVDVVEDDRLVRRAVRLGAAHGDDVEVLAGLRTGERVALPERAR